MIIKSVQKVIKIGSSAGVTIPAKDLKKAKISIGDEIEITIRQEKSLVSANDAEVLAAAKKILADYKIDFKNLANR